MNEPQPFKALYNVAMATDMAEKIAGIETRFDQAGFVEQIAASVDTLELKGRINLFAAALRDHLPPDYPEALAILLKLLGPSGDYSEGMFNDGWQLMPIAAFVERYGLDYLHESLAAMHAITQRNTAEFAIRPFIERYPDELLATLRRWTSDRSEHVRRLVSEGTRTRLPWAARLPAFIADPAPVLELLELLRDDPSLYVRKSVANNLNDIAKDHPDFVLATLTRWNADASDGTRWIIRHALRTLIKQGHPEALELLGVGAAQIRLVALRLDPDPLPFDGTLTVDLTLQSEESAPQQCIIDYVMHFMGANGRMRPKVFKLRSLTIKPGETVQLRQRHSFRPITIRRYYPGRHRAEIQVNGTLLGGADFTLAAPE